MAKIKGINLSKPVLVLVVFTFALLLFLIDWGFMNNSYTIFRVVKSFNQTVGVTYTTYYVDKSRNTVKTKDNELVNQSTCKVRDRKNWLCTYKYYEGTLTFSMVEGNYFHSTDRKNKATLCCVADEVDVTKLEWLWSFIITRLNFLY